MCDLEILEELIKPSALVSIENGSYDRREVRLTEPASQDHSGYTVKIRNMPQNSIVIKADAFPPPEHIFKGSKGECKRADFVIVTNTNAKNFIIFIEMKKGKGDKQKIIQQLKGAQCVVDYFRAIVNTFWEQAKFLDAMEYKYRFVSISNIYLNKEPTFQPDPRGIHDQAERMLKINAPHKLQFKRLIGRVAN